jgi:hypothetical protein
MEIKLVIESETWEAIAERICAALEKQNDLREEMVKAYSVKGTCNYEEEATDTDKPDYSEMRAYLAEKGIEVKKGSKYNTVYRMYTEAVNAPAEEVETVVAEETTTEETPIETVVAEAEVVVEPQETTTIPMTKQELRERVMANYDNSVSDCNNFREALKVVGAQRVTDLKEDGDCDKVWAEYAKLKGIA